MRLAPLKQRPPLNAFKRGQLIPKGNPPMPWNSFTTHAQVEAWVQRWQENHTLILPQDWGTWTLEQKRTWLSANVDPSEG